MILCGKISYQLSEHALEESLMRLFCFLAMHFRLRCEIFSPRQSLRRFTGTLTQQETTLSMGGRPCLQQTGLPGVRQACLASDRRPDAFIQLLSGRKSRNYNNHPLLGACPPKSVHVASLQAGGRGVGH